MGERRAALILLLILCFAVSSLIVLVNAVEESLEMWSQTYGGENEDIAFSLVATSDGGYAMAGYTRSFGAGGEDFWLVKTDAEGNMEWNQTYGGTMHDQARSLVETSDGGYAIAGYTSSFGAGSGDFWLIKTDEYGNMEWNQTYGGTDSEQAFSMIETSDGGYALAGQTSSFDSGWGDFWLVKTDAEGNMEWNKAYGKSPTSDYAYSLVETSDGGYALIGFARAPFSPEIYDFLLIKTDEFGNMEWNQTYGGAGYDYYISLVETSDGGFTIATHTRPYDINYWDVWLVKTDVNGNINWDQIYEGTGSSSDSANSLVKMSDGGYAIIGNTWSYGAGGSDYWLIKTDEYGNMEWNQTYGGRNNDIAYSLVETSDGGFAFAGGTRSFGAGNNDFWLVKTDAQGIPEFPSWTPLLIMLLAVVVIAVVYRRRFHSQQKEK